MTTGKHAQGNKARGEAAILAHGVAKSRPGYPDLLGKRTQFELLTATVLMPSSIYQPIDGSVKATTTAMATVASVLVAHWNPTKHCAWPSHETLEHITGMRRNTLDQALKGLREAGLFGIVSGKRGVASEYFPLFSEQSRESFMKAIGAINPIASTSPPVESEDAEDDISARIAGPNEPPPF